MSSTYTYCFAPACKASPMLIELVCLFSVREFSGVCAMAGAALRIALKATGERIEIREFSGFQVGRDPGFVRSRARSQNELRRSPSLSGAQTKSAALVAATNQEIEEDRRVHDRAASFRLERRLHDIRTRAFEAEVGHIECGSVEELRSTVAQLEPDQVLGVIQDLDLAARQVWAGIGAREFPQTLAALKCVDLEETGGGCAFY